MYLSRPASHLLPVGGDVPNRFEQNGFGQVVQVTPTSMTGELNAIRA